jgi:Bacterial type II/III secretion system short domain
MSLINKIAKAALTGLSLVLALTLAPVTFGQEATTPNPSPKATPKPPDYVEEKGFKGRVFEIKYRDPNGLLQVMRPLGSGFKGATMSVEREFNTLTVRDFPENIASIEEAIKRLDTPQAPRPDIEFSVHVLIASNLPGGPEGYPAELGDVVKQLKSALKYKSYSLMTSAVHRAKEGPGGVRNSGVAESNLFSSVPTPPNPIFYEYSLQSISIDSAAGAAVQVGELRFNMRVPLNLGTSVQYQDVGFRSPVGLRQGEKVVVGSTTMGDKGLVVVVSAKLLK